VPFSWSHEQREWTCPRGGMSGKSAANSPLTRRHEGLGCVTTRVLPGDERIRTPDRPQPIVRMIPDPLREEGMGSTLVSL
jgi:hypothetical protein